MQLSRTVPRALVVWSRALLVSGAVAAGACRDEGIVLVEPLNLAATVYGVATAAGQPVVERTVEALGMRLACDRYVPIFGQARTDAAGRYRLLLGGTSLNSRICVRVGLPPASGTDTLFVFDTLEVRADFPFDSIRVDMNRAAP